jgi:hypothetical protein
VTLPRIIDVDARVPIRPITENPSHVSLIAGGVLNHFHPGRYSTRPLAHHPRIDVKAQHDRAHSHHPARTAHPAGLHVDNKCLVSPSLTRQPMPGFAARIVHSLALIRRTNTAGRSSTHQRASNGLCSANQSKSLLSIGTHIIDLIRQFAIAGRISIFWEEHGKIDHPARRDHGPPCDDCDTGSPELHQASNRWRSVSIREMHGLEGQNTGGGTGRTAEPSGGAITDLFAGFRVSSVQILAAAFPEKSARPSLKPFRLGDLSSHWNAPRWASGLRGFVFPVRRYPDAAEHNSRSVTLAWLRGGW